MNPNRAKSTLLIFLTILTLSFLGCKNDCPYFENPSEISINYLFKNKIKKSISLEYDCDDSLKKWHFVDTVEISEYSTNGLLIKKTSKESIRLNDYYKNGLIRLSVTKEDSIKKYFISYRFDNYKKTIQLYFNRIKNPKFDLTFENSDLDKKESAAKIFLNKDLKVIKIDNELFIIDYNYNNDLLVKEVCRDKENKPKDMNDNTYCIYSYNKGKLKTIAYYNRLNYLQKITYINDDCLIDSITELNEHSKMVKVVRYKYERF
jgi:hypothetical protein